MDITMITKLLDAGFTAEEIRGMGVLSVRADPAPAAVPEDPAPQVEPEKEPEHDDAPADTQKPEPKMDAILQKIDNLTGSITALLNRSAGSRTQDQKETVDDILAKAFFMKEE